MPEGDQKSDTGNVSYSHLQSCLASDPEAFDSQAEPHTSPEPVQAWAAGLAGTLCPHAIGIWKSLAA